MIEELKNQLRTLRGVLEAIEEHPLNPDGHRLNMLLRTAHSVVAAFERESAEGPCVKCTACGQATTLEPSCPDTAKICAWGFGDPGPTILDGARHAMIDGVCRTCLDKEPEK